MITPELKDKVLNKLISFNDVTFDFDINNFAKEINCSEDTLCAILDYFVRLKLISNANYCFGGAALITLNVEASDMALRGGFVAQEELIKKNFEKLLLELKSLDSTLFKKTESLTNIIASLSTALQLARWFG